MRLEPIGHIRSCFREKFGIPRQAGLTPDSTATIRLRPDRALREGLEGLEEFTHLWVVTLFHGALAEGWRSKVRPPRLGGARRVGVFASRSPHRPNPIGLSAVRIVSIDRGAPGGPEIRVSGGDFLDGTPVLDLKPYVPYADSIPRARAAWAGRKPARIPVRFTANATRECARLERERPGLARLIRQVVGQDPRPAFHSRKAADPAGYSARLLDLDVHWEVRNGAASVREIEILPEEKPAW